MWNFFFIFYQWGGKKTALSLVCERGYFEIAKFLIEKGAKVDQTKTVSLSFSLSLLIGSCFHFFKIIILFEQGGESPLWICCERRDFEMANLLIDNKAKVDWSTNVKFF